MTKYNSLNNTYKQEKVFEAMFKTRSSVYTKRMITDAFNTAVDGIYKDTNKDTGGGGRRWCQRRQLKKAAADFRH